MLVQIDGPFPQEFLPQEAERTLNSLGRLSFLSIIYACFWLFERTYPAPTVEERKQKEKQRYTAITQQSFSMNIQ